MMSKFHCHSESVIARETARMLLEVEAIHIRPDQPFTLTSGKVSPVYVDCRKLISFPHVRSTLMDFAVMTVQHAIGYEAFDVIAGGETAGIPFAAWISERLSLPMVYVRKKPKGFGRNAQIEGVIPEGARVLLVEDMSTDGGSKRIFAEALRKAGAEVAHSQVIFYYDIFPHASDTLAEAGLTLHHLATWHDILALCKAEQRYDAATLSSLEAFIKDPEGWKANR